MSIEDQVHILEQPLKPIQEANLLLERIGSLLDKRFSAGPLESLVSVLCDPLIVVDAGMSESDINENLGKICNAEQTKKRMHRIIDATHKDFLCSVSSHPSDEEAFISSLLSMSMDVLGEEWPSAEIKELRLQRLKGIIQFEIDKLDKEKP